MRRDRHAAAVVATDANIATASVGLGKEEKDSEDSEEGERLLVS
jgi:hypothetical protein